MKSLSDMLAVFIIVIIIIFVIAGIIWGISIIFSLFDQESTPTNTCYLFCDITGYEPQWAKSIDAENALRTCVDIIPLDNSNDSLWCDEFYEYYLLGITEFDLNSETEEAVRLTVAYYNSIESAYQNLYNHCSNVSNYNDYLELRLIAADIQPIIRELNDINAEIKNGIIQLGLADNTEIIFALRSAANISTLTIDCLNDRQDKYE